MNQTFNYKGTLKKDRTSKRYKCFKVIDKEYGCLMNFLEDIELSINKEHIIKDEKVLTMGEVRKLFGDMYNNLPDDDEELI